MEGTKALGLIRRCLRRGRVLWVHHAHMRVAQRGLRRAEILESVDTYEVLELRPPAPGSRYLPAALVRAEIRGEVIHVVFALDEEGDNVRVVTAYRPDPALWDRSFRRRKSR